MPKPVVDEEKCIGCGTCVSVCPVGVYELSEGKAKVVNPDACVGCKACEAQCPVNAIKVEE
ncbi:MAG: ferredoxin [Thermoprotei archaeon]|nr:MAG: ferredoxin [Thermoprotei archaeon]RLE99552.1 MAG: ferredoxin [Thermoprotei archaeon]